MTDILFLVYYVFTLLIGWTNSSNIGCNTHATILRELDREGFHINVHSLVELVVDVESASKWDNCLVLLRENVSESFYVNPDQLSDQNRSGISQACTAQKVDTEAPQHLSLGHTVFVYSTLQRSQNLVFSHLNFPIHLRYQKPKPYGGYSTAELNSPILLISCPNIECNNLLKSKAPCFMCDKKLCSWMRFPFKINTSNFTLTVPVGNLSHLWFISPVTYILTYGGCLYVLITIVFACKE